MALVQELRCIDSGGHALEHLAATPQCAPARYGDRMWHRNTGSVGVEWLVSDDRRNPANSLVISWTAGMTETRLTCVRQIGHRTPHAYEE